jgi:hypothetical protein
MADNLTLTPDDLARDLRADLALFDDLTEGETPRAWRAAILRAMAAEADLARLRQGRPVCPQCGGPSWRADELPAVWECANCRFQWIGEGG